MFGGKQTKKEIFEKDAADFNTKSNRIVTGDQCLRKWGKLVEKYKEIEDHNNKSGNDRKTWKFHDELSQCLADNVSVNPACTMESSSACNKEVKEQEAESDESEASDVDESESTEASHGSSSSSVLKGKQKLKKRSRERPKSKLAAAEMLEFLQDYSEKRQKAEEEKVKVLKEMKEQKQVLFDRFFEYMGKK